MRDHSYLSFCTSLAASCDEAAFVSAFGEPTTNLAALVKSNTVTLPLLLHIAPPGTPDPTPLLYTDTMYGCASLLALGFVANAAVRPVHASHHMAEDPPGGPRAK